MRKRAFSRFVFVLVVPLLYTNALAATESKSLTPGEDILHQATPEGNYPSSPLPSIDKTIVPPPPQTPVPPSLPKNRGAFNPKTGERYPPSGKGVINPITGEYYPPSGNGFFNPRTGEYYPPVDH